MALEKCRECGKEISTEAAACPQCGAKEPTGKSMGCLGRIVFGTVLFVALGALASQCTDGTGSSPAPSKTAAELEAESKRSERLKLAAGAVLVIRKNLRNPDSLEVSEVLLMPDGASCITYRAQNGFGGMNLERIVVTDAEMVLEQQSGFATMWNRHCANKTGEIVTGIVSRLVKSAT